ncbi:MAG: SCO family protein [Rhodospirillales bacterium]|nr:SCO family protein [Rhodospirillales bacterium]
MRQAFASGLAGVVLSAMLLTPAPATAHQQPSPTDPEAAIAYSQAAVGRQVEDLAFVDVMRRSVRLSGYRGKPLVVNLVYTGCADICPIIVQTLNRAVSVAESALGPGSFHVVTIGFDARDDTPERMRAFTRSQGLPNWEFLSGDEATIELLAAQLGFVYYPSPKGFDHLAQTTVLDSEGRVYRQVYGSDFEPPALVEPLKDLAYGTQGSLASVSGILNRVRLFCTLYDPRLGRYRVDYSMLIGGTVGFLSLAALAVIAMRAWWRSRARPEQA